VASRVSLRAVFDGEARQIEDRLEVVVPVAAILVVSIQLTFLDAPLNLQYKGPNHIRCEACSGRATRSASSTTAPRSSSLRPRGSNRATTSKTAL
jgi:hypothetical protein